VAQGDGSASGRARDPPRKDGIAEHACSVDRTVVGFMLRVHGGRGFTRAEVIALTEMDISVALNVRAMR